jgi:hypothetical protein
MLYSGNFGKEITSMSFHVLCCENVISRSSKTIGLTPSSGIDEIQSNDRLITSFVAIHIFTRNLSDTATSDHHKESRSILNMATILVQVEK